MDRAMSALDRDGAITQKRPLEIIFRLGKFSVEVGCLLTRRHDLPESTLKATQI